MLAQWTGELVGKMHNHKISKTQLADNLGVTREYVSMVLNGHRTPAGAEEKFCNAVDEIIKAFAKYEALEAEFESRTDALCEDIPPRDCSCNECPCQDICRRLQEEDPYGRA